MEKNREKAWDHYYVTDQKWWTWLVRTQALPQLPITCGTAKRERTWEEAKAVQHMRGPSFNYTRCLIDPLFDFVYTEPVLNQINQLTI